MLSVSGDLCGSCGQMVRVYEVGCRCDMVRGQDTEERLFGFHQVAECACFFPRFEPKCSDSLAQVIGRRQIG